jgi:hypothetical protein
VIVSRAAGHQVLIGPRGRAWRCLARRGMLHSECEVIDHWELDTGAVFELNRCNGIEELVLVVSGHGVLHQPEQPPRDVRASQLILAPYDTSATLVAGPAGMALLSIQGMPAHISAVLPPRVPEVQR